jgi:hypothetical protein
MSSGRPNDMRDPLVSVLLVDSETVVGTMDELVACQQRLAELAEAADREEARLAEILSRLAAAGLRPEQLARLADLPVTEVCRLSPARPRPARNGPGPTRRPSGATSR